jgi:hypothetical protein
LLSQNSTIYHLKLYVCKRSPQRSILAGGLERGWLKISPVDASPVGLGFILVQGNESEQKRVVAYASKTSTAVEQRYSQTERED